jgi:Protein of unknown function (DUF992)
MLSHWMIGTLVAMTLAAGAGAASSLGSTTELGDLTCSLADQPTTDTATSSQSRAMRCLYRPTGTGLEETYTGTLLAAGDAERVLAHGVLAWVVRGPRDDKARAGLLEQTYAAAPTEIGTAMPPLVAEGNSPVSLQPVRQRDLPSRAPIAVLGIDLKLKTSIG